MRRAGQITLAAALAVCCVVPGAVAQSGTRSSASTIVGAAAAQWQTGSSKFLGAIGSGRSSWQAGNGSFGKREISTRPGLVELSKQTQAGSTAAPVAFRSESPRSSVDKPYANAKPGLKTEELKSRATVRTVLAKGKTPTRKKRLSPQVQLGARKTSGNTARGSGSGSVLFGGTKTEAVGVPVNSSGVKSQLGRTTP